jgi:hypothetical protein
VSPAVAVVAHPARLAAAEQLASELGAHLVVDRLGEGEWPTHARALAWAAQQDAAHALIVQDDAVPVPGLLEHVGAAVAAYPDGPIGLYVGRSRPRPEQVARAVRRADEIGASWLEANTLLWGVATVLPAADLAGLLAWGKRCHLPYDQRIGCWYRNQRRPVRYTWPSLVDHADGPSLLAGGARTVLRVAWRTGAPASWDGPVVPIGPRWRAS